MNEGFTFFELLVSVFILAVGLIVILQAFSLLAQSAALSCDMVNAVSIAKEELQDLEFQERYNSIGNYPNKTSGSSGKFNWTQELGLDQGKGLYSSSFNITWRSSKRNEKISLNSYFR